MDLAFSADDEAFRDQVLGFIVRHFTADMAARAAKSLTGYLYKVDHLRWQRALYEKGWIAPRWPVAHGGTGWSPTRRYIYETELARADTPRIFSHGLRMVGPVIMAFGSEAQKEYFLPRILASRDWWCQGYSEPGAGSDLASLQCRAVVDGDDYIVDGTKTWTTRAQDADWIYCLVRTSTEGKRQEGISFLLIDMTSPGIEVRPLILLDQTAAPVQEVNQVFLDQVRVPRANLVGEENQGWTVAKYLLEFERGGPYAGWLQGGLERLRRIASGARAGGGPLLEDVAFRRKLMRLEVEAKAVEMSEFRLLSALSAGARPGAESSLLKVRGTEVLQAITALAIEAVAYYAIPYDPNVLDFAGNAPAIGPDDTTSVAGRYVNHRKMSIYGGSNEIQRSIIAKLILGL